MLRAPMSDISPGVQRAQTAGHRILDRLRDEGRLTARQYEALYHGTRRSGELTQDALIDQGVMSEAELLAFLARVYKTQFVTSEKLARAATPEHLVLELVSHRLAERLFCAPILLDRVKSSLSIVVPDLEDDIAKQVQLVANTRDVHPIIARPAAIRAALRKFYLNDQSAFNAVLPTSGVPQLSTTSPQGEIVLTQTNLGLSAPPLPPDMEFADPSPTGSKPRRGAGGGRGPTPNLEIKLDERASVPPARPAEPATPNAALLDVIGTLVSLLEQGRGDLRGHSALVARVTRRMCERMKLPPVEIDGIFLAAAVHDLGNTTNYHLTALNVAKFEGHRLQAQRSVGAPLRLLDAAKVPPLTRTVLENLHERWDGEGQPARKKGTEIPLGARIVSMAETYADLVANAKNPYRRTLSHAEAIDVVRQLSGTLFDPDLIDGLRLAGSSAVHGGFRARARVLVVEPDNDEATALEVRFSEQGATVLLASRMQEARSIVDQADKIDVVVSEADVEKPGDGLALVSAMKAGAHRDATLLFVAKRHDRQLVSKALELGAADFVTKPVLPEVVVTKAMQALEAARRKKGGGLSGSVRDMGIPEVIQVLGQTRKTGVLRVGQGTRTGEVQIDQGQIVHASWGREDGEESFFRMLLLQDGEFVFDASAKPTKRTMEASTESLLLEGMRRIDEGTIS
jgi:response regulator RpfG family c-di-GMP phosphodiesterase